MTRLANVDTRLTGEASTDYAGWALASAGDTNADGTDDLLIGAHKNDASGEDAGAAYLVLGPVSGNHDLGDVGIKLTGEEAGDYAGYAVASAGDVDEDGSDDLLIGAPHNATNGADAGAAYLLLGPLSSSLDLSSAAAIFLGEEGDTAGWAVSSAGDINGDNLDDLIIGAPSSNSGTVYVVTEATIGTHMLSASTAVLSGASVGSRAGAAVAGGGDINGDGLADLLVGAHSDSSGGTQAGAAYLLLGGPGL